VSLSLLCFTQLYHSLRTASNDVPEIEGAYQGRPSAMLRSSTTAWEPRPMMCRRSRGPTRAGPRQCYAALDRGYGLDRPGHQCILASSRLPFYYGDIHSIVEHPSLTIWRIYLLTQLRSTSITCGSSPVHSSWARTISSLYLRNGV